MGKKECGTWFLSYLSDYGVFELDSDVFHNTASGILKQTMCGIPEGSHVNFNMSNKDKLQIKYLLPDCTPSLDEWEEEKGEYIDRWWCDTDDHHPQLLTMNVNVNVSYSIE